MLKAKHHKQPRVIDLDKNAACPPALEELKSEKILEEKSEVRWDCCLKKSDNHRVILSLKSFGDTTDFND